MSEHDNEDRDILAALREGLEQSDPVPSGVVEFAKAAFTWREIDAELAELGFDSVDEDLPAGVRSATTARLISFQAGQWMIDVEYDEARGRLIGAITPTTTYSLELHTSGGRFTRESDDQGRFTADGVSAGPFAMILRMADGEVVKTQWVIL